MKKTKLFFGILTAFLLAFAWSAFNTTDIFADDGDESGSAKVKFESDEVSYTFDPYNNYECIYLDDGDAVSWSSSNESVVKISSSESYYAGLELLAPGSSTITATDEDGLSATCTVKVLAPEIVVDGNDFSFSAAEENPYFYVLSGYGLSYSSSDESVLKISNESDDSYCYLEFISPGSATVTITDCVGATETVDVTVKESEWSIDKTVINGVLSDNGSEIYIDTEDWGNSFSAVSSNTKVVTVDKDDYGYGCISLSFRGVGTATITISDKFGKTATCEVNLKPDPISFGDNSKLVFNNYETDGDEYTEYWLETDGNSIISTVSSSNEKVVKAKRIRYAYDGSINYFIQLIPVSVGSATITATDQYGQTATMQVTVTQKYIDESKYLESLYGSYVEGPSYDYSGIVYGDTKLYCWCDITANVYTIIKGKKYTGYVDEEGYYVIRGIPKLPAGTKITVVFQKGLAKYNCVETIQKKHASYLRASAKAQVYSGKALTPGIVVKDGNSLLKKGTDYTVKYSNNKNVGKAKATVSFKGNYKGSKAVYFNINPKGTSISKLKKGKKSFKVKWKKQTTQTQGYQIIYSLDSSFKSGNKIVTVKGNKKTSKKIKKLKKKKKYYVKVRTYKTVGGTKYYSAWSGVKKLNTKTFLLAGKSHHNDGTFSLGTLLVYGFDLQLHLVTITEY